MVLEKLRNTLHLQNGPKVPKNNPKTFFGSVTITNTLWNRFTRLQDFMKKMLDGPQEIEEHICQNGSKYTQMTPRRDGDAMKKCP